MKTKILDSIINFTNSMNVFSAEIPKTFEITVPIEIFYKLKDEIETYVHYYRFINYEFDKSKLVFQCNGNIVVVSCKEINNEIIKDRLSECFKILSK